MDSSRHEIKIKFKELEQSIERIASGDTSTDDTTTTAISTVKEASEKNHQLLTDPEDEDKIEISLFSGSRSGSKKPLIAPVEADNVAADNNKSSVDCGKLLTALRLPLVALGSANSDALTIDGGIGGLAEKSYSWWTGMATQTATDEHEALSAMIASRFVGPWYRKAILGTSANLILANPELMEVAQQYLSDRVTGHAAVVALVTVFASKVVVKAHEDNMVESLTLATRLLAHAAETGILSPQAIIDRVIVASRDKANGSRMRLPMEWSELVQIMCSVPERMANRVDPQSVPLVLRPRQYFARLAREAVALSTSDSAQTRFIVDLWAKLCRVGQSDYLCVELAAAMVLSSSSESSEELDRLAQIVCSVPVPFRETLEYGIACQLEHIARGAAGIDFNARMAKVFCSLLNHHQLDSQSAAGSAPALSAEQAVASMLFFRGSTTFISDSAASLAVMQSLVLAMQLISGDTDSAESDLPSASDSSNIVISPGFLHAVLKQTIIPAWSSLAFPVKPMTELVLMCVGGMAPADRERVAMTSVFSEAIPKFLDAPTTRVRLSGIVVADCVVNTSRDVDFGLDDILRDAKRPSASETVVASAAYIRELRAFARPIHEQWTDASLDKPLLVDEAIERARAYAGEEEEEEEQEDEEQESHSSSNRVLAPRQSSLTGGGPADSGLQSGFVKPRTPAFLRDCLSYLKPANAASGSQEAGGGDAEKVRIGLFALTKCTESANLKTVEELWLQTANRVLYTYNRGPEHLDAAWDRQRRSALVALAVRLPRAVGPFLADRSCDRNMTIRDRELVLSAIAAACIRMAGVEGDSDDVESALAKQLEQTDVGGAEGSGAGTVVRRSRRLDIVRKVTRQAADIEPAFFFPLVAQFGRSDMSSAASDIRRSAALLERYLSTLGVILHVCGSSSRQIAMAREFWAVCRLVRALADKSVSEAPPVLEALLFGIDVVLSPERALSAQTLAREFRADISDTLAWIGVLLEERQALLEPSAVAHAVRILGRLREIQEKVYEDRASII
ncbi:telomere binding protein [Coemansia sp. RSA 1939]|nr:telomere binding protein [Coemansia sp. RSA 1939]KAJ2610428.1 telomere binding protein [Coemansia sp. RSA 1804]